MVIRHIEEKTAGLINEVGITKAPVDPIICAKHLSVDVKSISIANDISGLFVMKDNMAYIMYNKNEKNKKRQRFTIAHELGHYVLHKNIPLIIDKWKKDITIFRDISSTTGEVQREREANAFAASLLMPKFLIDKEINRMPQGKDVLTFLSDKFNVSMQAMNFRLINLELIDYGLY
jgi:Zn-dependent peptidase ImmA (M78 family)